LALNELDQELRIHKENYSQLKLSNISQPYKLLLLKIAENGGRAKFNELLGVVGGEEDKKPTLYSRLKRLEQLGYIKYYSGVATLVSKTPLCFVMAADVDYAYVGLLGRKVWPEINEPEPITAISKLAEKGLRIRKIVIVTTQEAYGDWASYIQKYSQYRDIDWKMITIKQMNNIQAVADIVEPKVFELSKQYIPILDCTSGTRPAGIAYHEIAHTLMTPLIYVYTSKEFGEHGEVVEVNWLKNQEKMAEELRLSELVKKIKTR